MMRVFFLLNGTANPTLLLQEPGTLAQQIAYRSEKKQYDGLRLPDRPGPHPVAILIHEGCWQAARGNLDSRIGPAESVPG